jgi:hypothetical protein
LICFLGYNPPKNTPFLFNLKKWRGDEENGRKMVSLMFSPFEEDVSCVKRRRGEYHFI